MDPVCGICGEHEGHETAELRDVRRADGERGLRGGAEKGVDGCLLDDLRAFGINADQWTTVAQDEGEWRKAEEQGAERFMAKWVAAEKVRAGLAGLRYVIVCIRTWGLWPKKACSSWFTRKS